MLQAVVCYKNKVKKVGLAIKNKINERVVKREVIFITTKLWIDAHSHDSVVPALKDSLNKLGLNYVDLYLIHWSFAVYKNGSEQDTDYLETWQGLIDAKKQGLTKSTGVSNFNIKQLQRLIENSGVTPAVLQMNLNLQQPSLLKFCKSKNITVTGYTPFGSIVPQKASTPPPWVDGEKFVDIAKKCNKSVPQVVLRYFFKTHSTQLTQEERDLFKNYDKNFRTMDYAFWKKSPNYPF